MTTLPIPAELAALLQKASGAHARLQAVRAEVNLPSLDVFHLVSRWVPQSFPHFRVCVCTGGEELHSDCLALVQAPTVRVDPQLTLPLDINNYLMTHYVRAIFRVKDKHMHTEQNRFCASNCVNMSNEFEKGILGELTWLCDTSSELCVCCRSRCSAC